MRTYRQLIAHRDQLYRAMMHNRARVADKPHIRIGGFRGWRFVEMWVPVGRRGYRLMSWSGDRRIPKESVMNIAREMCDEYWSKRRAA